MIELTNAKVLDIDYRFEFLGDAINYRRVQSYTIEGTLLGRESSQGITGTWSLLTGISCPDDFEHIRVCGYDFKSGIFTSINFTNSPDQDVLTKNYNLSFDIYETGDISNIVGNNFSGIDLEIEGFPFVNSFSETFNLNQNPDTTFEFVHSLDLAIESGWSFNSHDLATGIAHHIIGENKVIDFMSSAYPTIFHSGSYNNYTETYDEINRQYSFTQRFQSQGEQKFTWILTNQFNISEGGVVEVSENGTIRGVWGSSPHERWQNALTGYNQISSGLNNRTSGIYEFYTTGIFEGAECPDIFKISLSTTENRCQGTIDYSANYSNDFRYQSTGCSHDYTTRISRSDAGIYSVSENGTIIALNVSNENNEKYNQSLQCFNDLSGQIVPRLSGFYTSTIFATTDCFNRPPLKKISHIQRHSKYHGTVGYEYQYSNDPKMSNDPRFVFIEHDIQDNAPVHFFNKFEIFNHKEVIQPSEQSQLAQFDNNIRIVARRGFGLNDCLNYATGILRLPPNANEAFIISANYTWNPSNREFNLDTSHNYSFYRFPRDILVW